MPSESVGLVSLLLAFVKKAKGCIEVCFGEGRVVGQKTS